MKKQIPMSARPAKTRDADTWVETSSDMAPPKKVKPKRLTLDMPPSLHSRLKLHCVKNQTEIASFLRELIAGALKKAED